MCSWIKKLSQLSTSAFGRQSHFNFQTVYFQFGFASRILNFFNTVNKKGFVHPLRPFENDIDFEKLYPSKGPYNNAIRAIGVNQFMLAALQFCKNEAQDGTIPIISVGSGEGNVERDIIDAYRRRFGKELRITLVDPVPEYKADFSTVDDLIHQRPHMVGHCVLLIIYPVVGDQWIEGGYDIEAISKLLPRAVLTLYEITGISGSTDFIAFLNAADDNMIKGHWWWRLRVYNERKGAVQLQICSKYSIVDVVRAELVPELLCMKLTKLVRVD